MKKKIVILIILVIGLGTAAIVWQRMGPESNKKTSSTVAKDPKSGAEFVCNHVQIIVNEGTPRSVIEQYAKDLNGKIISDFPGVSAYSLFVPGPCNSSTVDDAINFLRTKPEIKKAEAESIPYLN
jgi:hypothetical protein